MLAIALQNELARYAHEYRIFLKKWSWTGQNFACFINSYIDQLVTMPGDKPIRDRQSIWN